MTVLTSEPIVNIYQDRFNRQIDSGDLPSVSITKLIHRYLDGKPTKSGKRNLSSADRDCEFWAAEFWGNVSADIYETEAFALALARYLRQSKVTQEALLQRLLTSGSKSLRRAIQYSQLFLHPNESRWKEIQALDMTGAENFVQFLDACAIFQEEYFKLENAIKEIEVELKRLTPLEILVYASLFAFKHLVFDLGQQQLKPELFELGQIKTSNERFQVITDAINQILVSKLTSSSSSDFFISEKIIGESLKKHMSSLLFPSTARARDKCLAYLDSFENLVAAYLQFNEFIHKTMDCFCFDDDYDIRFEGERLILYPRVNPEGYEWGRNGKKLDRLHQYWHFRAIDEFIETGLVLQHIGTTENEENVRFAHLSAIRTKLELSEIYGLDDEITTDKGVKIDLFQTLLTIDLMHAFYKNGYILPYCKYREQTGNWLLALTGFSFMGLVEKEIRFPITFAEQKAKIARISDWTRSDEWPEGNKILTEAILDYWTNDLKESSRLLQENKYALLPELHERPIFKIGNYLFQLPWLFAFQNNVTAALNNLRRVGRKRGELNSETNRIEKRLAELFEAKGFSVIGNYQPPRNDLDEVGEIDLICFRDGHLFIFEIKSGYLRKSQRDAWHHKTNTLRKAGLQLQRKSAYVINNLLIDPKLTALTKDHALAHIQTHCWIVDTSLELDHEFFEGFLKVSIQEIIIALRNERHLLRDLHQAIATRKHQQSNGYDLGDVCADAMSSISEQNASDNLFPNGLSADQFATVIERDLVWDVLN